MNRCLLCLCFLLLPWSGVNLTSAAGTEILLPPQGNLLGFVDAENGIPDASKDYWEEDFVDASEVQQTVEEVLSDPEYRHLLQPKLEANDADSTFPDWLRRFLQWLFGGNQNRTRTSPDAMLALSTILFWLVILIVAGMLIALLISLLQLTDQQSSSFLDELSDKEAIAPSQPPGDLPSNEYERRAIQAAQSGDFRTGIRELVLGGMSWTERAGLIRYRRGLTNRDYVRAIWRMPDRRKSMLKIVSIFERIFYGRRTPGAKAFKVCLEEYQKSFSQEATDAHLED